MKRFPQFGCIFKIQELKWHTIKSIWRINYARKRHNLLWLWNPGQTSHQNSKTGSDDLTKMTTVLQNFFEKCNWTWRVASNNAPAATLKCWKPSKVSSQVHNERTWYFRLPLEVLLNKNSTFQVIIIDHRMRFFHDITELWVEFMLFNLDQVVFWKKLSLAFYYKYTYCYFLVKRFPILWSRARMHFSFHLDCWSAIHWERCNIN